MQAHQPIDVDWTINEIIRRHPETLGIFTRVGVDTCCGGALPLGEVARRHGLDAAALLDELRLTAAAA
jgi:regulator of cell morphogenesis and NO signaling